jgi:hypothetical protein
MKTLKRAGIAAAVVAALGVLGIVWVFTRDVEFTRDEKGHVDWGNIQEREREKDQLFRFLGHDISKIDITVREVDYTYITDAEKEKADAIAHPETATKGGDSKSGPDAAGGTSPGTVAVPESQQNVTEKKLGLARVDGKWTLTAPIHGKADQGSADGLATAIAELRVKGDVPDANPLDAKYGLNNPSVVANITLKKGRQITLRIGRDAPVGSDVYLMIEGEHALYYAASSVKTSLIKQPKDLRDKKVAQFETEDVKALVLDAEGSRVVCEQTGKKKEREWWLTKPTEARADNLAVDDVLNAVKGLEAKDFVDDVKSLGVYGLDKPTVVARLDFGKDEDDIVVKLGKHTQHTVEDTTSSSSPGTPKDMIYCMTEGRDEVFLVEADIESKLKKKPIDLRDTDIVDYETGKVNKITLERKGEKTIELVKADGKWSLQKPEFANADFSKVDNFLWDIKSLKAAEFLDDKPISPTVSGLDNPEINVTLSVEGQKAPIEVKFGYPDKSGRYYCQTSTLSAPVFVLDTFKDKIPTGIDALKEEKKEEPAPLTPTPAITPKAGTTSAPPPPVKEAK